MPSKGTARLVQSKQSVSLGYCQSERAISSRILSFERCNPKRWIVTQPLPAPRLHHFAQENGMARLFKQGSERKSVLEPRNTVELSNGVGNEQTRACHSHLAVPWSGNRIVLWLTTMRRRSATLGFGLVCGSALLL